MPKVKPVTRKAVSYKFGGGLAQLVGTEPPSYRQIIQHAYFLHNVDPELKERDLAQVIVDEVTPFWKQVNPRLPLLKNYSIETKINRLVTKAFLANRNSLKKNQINQLTKQLDTVFWIAACDCGLPEREARCTDKGIL